MGRASYKRIMITTIIIFLIGWLDNFIIEDYGPSLLLFITVILIIFTLSETMKLLTQFKKVENEIRDYVKKLFEEENKDDLRLEIINNIKEHNELANRNNEVDTVEKMWT